MRRKADPMDELHRIREAIYEEEKDLSPQERLKRLHEESEAFLARAGLKLKRLAPPSSKLAAR